MSELPYITYSSCTYSSSLPWSEWVHAMFALCFHARLLFRKLTQLRWIRIEPQKRVTQHAKENVCPFVALKCYRFVPPLPMNRRFWLTINLCFAALYNRTCYVDATSTGYQRRFRTRLGLTAGGTSSPGTFECPKCRKIYKWYRGLHRHLEYECGKTPRFKCPHCVYIGKHRSHVYSHIKSNHYNRPIYAIDLQQD